MEGSFLNILFLYFKEFFYSKLQPFQQALCFNFKLFISPNDFIGI